ncbi:MAG: aspartate dehydrogenase [Burkholderiaceae bacterium]|nr:aspartate dehydrogenase [Burkholderiaceae bacterium]
MRIGIIGYGAIGQALHRCLRAHASITVAGILVRPGGAARIGEIGIPVCEDISSLLALDVSLVAECAGHEALRTHGLACLAAERDLVAISAGALADDALRDALGAAARSAGRQLIVPAGAIGALDLLQAGRLAGLDSVRYVGRKPPAGWRGSPAEECIDLDAVNAATPFFEGSARDAARLYPRNANVAATVALASLGLDAVRVELVADPDAPGNVHEVVAEGAAGRLQLRTESKPSLENPRTSMITAYSVAHAILDRRHAIVFG